MIDRTRSLLRCLLVAAVLTVGAGMLVPVASAQTGPGGVGNSDGSGGQPPNLLWLRGGDGVTTSGGAVTGWSDQSGNGHGVTQGTGANQPTLTAGEINGVDVVTFDGSDDFLEDPGSTYLNGESGVTALVVVKSDVGSGSDAGILDTDDTFGDGQDDVFAVRYDASGFDFNGTNVIKFGLAAGGTTNQYQTEVTDDNVQTTTPQLITYRYEDGDGNPLVLLDGSAPNASTANTPSGTVSNMSRLVLGRGAFDGSSSWDGDIAEVILFGTGLNEAERTVVHTYLSEKYNEWDTGNEVLAYAYTGTYFNDFAGIGQSGGTSHTDAQSGALRLLGPQGLANDEFLLFGHDGASAASFTTSELPSDGSVDERIAREWRIDETNGDVGTVTVQIDADDLPNVASGNDYYVLVDSDGDFTGGTTATRLTLDSGTTYNADLDLADGDYVTLAIGSRPATPQNLTAESDLNQRVLLSWDAVTTDRTGSTTTLTGDEYRIYQNTADNLSGATQVATSTSTTDVEVTGLTNGTQYYFWVTAVNDVGESNEQGSGTPATPALKVFFSSASSSGDEPGGINGFDVELSDTHTSNVDVTLSESAAIRSVNGITSIDAGGSGYSDGDIIGENDGGDGGSGLQIEVTAVDGSGAVTSATVANGGSGYTAAPISFTTLSGGGSGANFTVTLQADGSDFTLNTTTVTIPSGNTSTSLGSGDLSITNDTEPENSETIPLALSSPTTTGATVTLGAQTSHDVNVNDDDIPRKVYLVDGLNTPDDGLTSGAEETTVTYTLETSSVDAVNATEIGWEIDLTDPATTATADDFTSTSGTATIAANSSSTTFNLPIEDDATFEPNEDVVVQLVSVTNANLDDDPGSTNPANGRYTSLTHTIENSADGQPQVRFNAATSSVPDEGTAPSIQVDLSTTSSEAIDVNLSATGGTATGSGTDYTLATTTVTIPAGQGSVTLDGSDLSIINDELDEDNETVELTLQSVTSGTASVDTNNDTHTLTITDDDPLPTVAFDAASSNESESTSAAQITLSLSSVSGRDVSINYTVGGTATGGGTDYTDDDGGSVTITAGTPSTTIDLSLVDDTDAESDETVTVSFGGPDLTNANAGGTTSHTFSIIDDDFGSVGPGGVGSDDSNLLWVRADAIDGVSDGASLSAWADQSGNNHDLTAATAPTFNDGASGNAINGRPVVTFGGNGEFLQDDGNGNYLNGLDAVSIFSVVQSAATGTDAGYFDTEGSANGRDELLAVRYDDAGANSGRDDVIKIGINDEAQQLETSQTIDGVSVQQTAPQIHQVRWARGTDLTFALNGTDDNGNNLLSGSTVNASLQTNTVEIGRGPKASSTNGWNGQVAEVAVFNTALNVTQRTIVQNYLSAKYDVALTSGTADQYAGDDNGNGDYDRGVFGIGQEGSADFHLAAETDGLRFDKLSGLDNGDYLMAGHRAAVNAVNASDISGVSGLDARLERAWYTDVTDPGGDLTVDVTVDLSDAGLEGSASNKSNYVLLERAADAASGTDWTSLGTASGIANGDEITFAGVSLTDGTEITLGTTNESASPLGGQRAIVLRGTEGNEGSVTDVSPTGGDAGFVALGPPETGGTFGGLASDTDPQLIEFGLPGPMIYTYDSENSQWTEVTSGSTPLPNGEGFLLYVFDDEGSPDADPVDPTLPITVDDGAGTQGDADRTVSFSNAEQWLFVANPFAVPFDLENVSTTGGNGVKTTAQIYDRTKGFGGYSTSPVTSSATGDPETVGVGQGFFLECNTLNDCPTSVTLDKAGRVTGDRSVVGYKSKSDGLPERLASMGFGLTVEQGGDTVTVDRAAQVVFYEEATAGWDRYDATKLAPFSSQYAALAPLTPAGDSLQRAAQSGLPWPTTDEAVEVPLEVTAVGGVSGTATVRMREALQTDGWTVELVDTKEMADPSDDEVHPLTVDGEGYTFTIGEAKHGGATAKKRPRSPDSSSSRRAWEPGALALEKRLNETERAGTAVALARGGAGPSGPEGTQARTSGAKASSEEAPQTRLKLRVTPPQSALPVELAGFSAKQDRQQAVVQWQTASETNNAGFYVEHRRLPPDTTVTAEAEGPAGASSEKWSRLGFVEGAGTTTEPQSYRYETEDLSYGRHAFRLRQVDTDGTETLTEPVTLERRLDRAYAVESPYPNPTGRTAMLPITVREAQKVTVRIYDVLGRRVRTVRAGTMEGQETKKVRLSVGDLASGQYFVRVRGEEFVTTKRMTVVR